MRIWKTTLASLFGLLGATSPPAQPPRPSLSDIQQTMLAVLQPASGESLARITRRIATAEDLQALWFLRPDLMAALGSYQGEAQAQETVSRISASFQGMLPKGLAARVSPLACGEG